MSVYPRTSVVDPLGQAARVPGTLKCPGKWRRSAFLWLAAEREGSRQPISLFLLRGVSLTLGCRAPDYASFPQKLSGATGADPVHVRLLDTGAASVITPFRKIQVSAQGQVSEQVSSCALVTRETLEERRFLLLTSYTCCVPVWEKQEVESFVLPRTAGGG